MQTNRCHCGAPLPSTYGVVRCNYCGSQRFVGPPGPQKPARSAALLPVALGCAALLAGAMAVGACLFSLRRAQAPVPVETESAAGKARREAEQLRSAAQAAAEAAEAARAEAARAQPAERETARAAHDSAAGGTARVAIGALDVRGALSRDVVYGVIDRHRSEVRDCYTSALASRPELEGRIAVSLVISPEGAIQAAGIGSSTIDDTPLALCITQAARGWTFPAPGVVVGVDCPFVLSTEPPGAETQRGAEP